MIEALESLALVDVTSCYILAAMSHWSFASRYIVLPCALVFGACNEPDESSLSSPSAACRERAPTTFRVKFVGSGFTELDGRVVTAVTSVMTIDADPVLCRAAETATIDGGAFTARVENRRDEAVYPRIGVFVDSNANGRCDAETDLVWTRVTTAGPADVEDAVDIKADSLAFVPDAEGCALLR